MLTHTHTCCNWLGLERGLVSNLWRVSCALSASRHLLSYVLWSCKQWKEGMCLFNHCQVPAYAIVLFETTFLMVLRPTHCVLSLGQIHEYLGGAIPLHLVLLTFFLTSFCWLRNSLTDLSTSSESLWANCMCNRPVFSSSEGQQGMTVIINLFHAIGGLSMTITWSHLFIFPRTAAET